MIARFPCSYVKAVFENGMESMENSSDGYSRTAIEALEDAAIIIGWHSRE